MLAAALLALTLGWIVPAEEAVALPQGSVTILDARGGCDYRAGHVPGAIRINWMTYRRGWFRSGKLPKDLDALARKMAKLGVDQDRPVIVIGGGREAWGEDGRIVWMLAHLGHEDVRQLDGGWDAWVAAGGPVSKKKERALAATFAARPVASLRASKSDVASAKAQGVVLLDVRTTKEWNGARPYWESRGGHVPDAVHLHWKDLLDEKSRLDPAAKEKLEALGVKTGTPVITYCTGGVRSAEALVVLKALGFTDVRNYDGSWYEWSADKKLPVAK